MSDSHYYSVCMEHGDYIDRDGVTQWGCEGDVLYRNR